MNKKTRYILFGILFLGIILHLWRIPMPKKAVFDEKHYATYAAQYVTQTPFFDIHPPLGKFIYSIPLHFFSAKTFADIPFTKLTKSGYVVTNDTYTTFPYTTLRIVSSLFGMLLIFSVFLFMRELTKNDTIALLSAFFVSIDNALLLETRLILLEGIFLSFAFLALWQFLKQNDHGIYSGILWGCALATKLVGIIFLPLIFFIKNHFWKRYIFISSGFITLGLLWFGIQMTAFQTNQWYDFQKTINPNIENIINLEKQELSRFENFSLRSFLFLHEISMSVVGYSVTNIEHNQAQSTWLDWPFMKGSFLYQEYPNKIAMVGNPALWAIGLLSVLFSIVFVLIRKIQRKEIDSVLKILLLSYGFTLIPFALIPRHMFIWQYFSALIFSFCIAAYWFVHLNNVLDGAYKNFSYIILISIVVLCFAMVSPLTFGF